MVTAKDVIEIGHAFKLFVEDKLKTLLPGVDGFTSIQFSHEMSKEGQEPVLVLKYSALRSGPEGFTTESAALEVSPVTDAKHWVGHKTVTPGHLVQYPGK